MIEKFVKVAISQIGYREGKNNATKYGIWYGMPNQPWCAMFVSWCANQAGILGKLVPKYAACSVGYKWFKDKGLITSKAKRGYVGFTINSKGEPSHTFIVEKVNGKKITTIEGNLNNRVCRNTRTLSSKLKFGIVEEKDEWTNGVYKLLEEKALRKSHNLGNNIYKVKECNKTIQPYLTSNRPNNKAYIRKDEDVRIVDIYKQGKRVWGKLNFKTPYWLVLCNINGKAQAKKI